jgi:hypothetical protein
MAQTIASPPNARALVVAHRDGAVVDEPFRKAAARYHHGERYDEGLKPQARNRKARNYAEGRCGENRERRA